MPRVFPAAFFLRGRGWQSEKSRITIAASQRKQRQPGSNRRVVRSEITQRARKLAMV